jgi:Fe/S biogenesis protein NfuA
MKFINQNDFYLESYKITPKEFYSKKKDGSRPIVLDIRPLDISSAISVEGSYSLPSEMFNERLIQLPPFGTIILYSDKENTDISNNMYLLWENGFTEIFYVDGGFDAIMAGLFEVSEQAQKNGKEYLKKFSKIGAKIQVKGQDYSIEKIATEKELEGLFFVDFGGFGVYINPDSQRLLQSSKIDFQDNKLQIDHPRMHEPRLQGTVKERVQKILDEQINPMVETHGGVINLIDVVEETVYIEMGGGCQGCGMSTVTLKKGVETAIKDNIPEINHILDTTDHAAGTNPYYKPEEA